MHWKITLIWLVESLFINPKQCNYKYNNINEKITRFWLAESSAVKE